MRASISSFRIHWRIVFVARPSLNSIPRGRVKVGVWPTLMPRFIGVVLIGVGLFVGAQAVLV